jgi:hypothetical protein
VNLPIAIGDTTPVPSLEAQGAIVWSTTLGYIVGWTGSSWQAA